MTILPSSGTIPGAGKSNHVGDGGTISEVCHPATLPGRVPPTLLLAEPAVELADYAYMLGTGRTVLRGKAADRTDNRDMQRIYLGLETPE
jgi:hypothetical protein